MPGSPDSFCDIPPVGKSADVGVRIHSIIESCVDIWTLTAKAWFTGVCEKSHPQSRMKIL